ncbi:MAG: bifunctional hydroxymethylpyrimidine kinase/phosphomethylpyrimidine kinase, partial [Holdemanella sp.]|nr:bifunctional hydroxymethylpyrimidine kinase/phosphomethylpyrimidine kinase [Holdemanella sp.]
LRYYGNQVFVLPTGLVSNTFDYGKFEIVNTLEYMKNTLNVWKQLDFKNDVICTGFILDTDQSSYILDVLKESDAYKMVDPIMGDDGKLYNGIDDKTIRANRELCAVADLVVPNFTEASFLTDLYTGKTVVSKEEVMEVIDGLRKLGSKNILITSLLLDDGKHYIAGYEDDYFFIEFDYLPVRIPGTGDIFSSVLIAELSSGSSLFDATNKAKDFVFRIVEKNVNVEDAYKGVNIERYLHLLGEVHD